MSHTIYHNLTITAPPQQVFDAISLPVHLINWWPMRCSGSPVLNAEYNFNFTDEYDWHGMVSKMEPNKSFHIKMTQSDGDWNPTTIEFELDDLGDKMSVRFSHRNWPELNDHFKYSSFCWAILLNGLKNYIEKGEIIPFDKRE